jgi:hypothetical protein
VASPLSSPSSLDIIIPAYNEEENIEACVESVLNCESSEFKRFDIWIADDQSTDATGKIAQKLASLHPNVHALSVPPRPKDKNWFGKNWACTYAVQYCQREYLLFVDADVRLLPGAISAALAEAQSYQTDLLSCAPKIECSCLAEWLVQPIMMSVIPIIYDFQAINCSDKTEKAFAAGPFMLFRREAYNQIGTHEAVHDVIIEDVELARLIRGKGLRLRYILGIDLIKVRMYSSFASLWEGWTKNYYLGTQENIPLTLFSAFTIGMVFVMPWLGLVASLWLSFLSSYTSFLQFAPLLSCYSLTGFALIFYFRLRFTTYHRVNVPIRYWWLSGIGGIIVIAIAVTSIIKTKTGWGWTWRGRSLRA